MQIRSLTQEQVSLILSGAQGSEVADEFPFYPLTSPGIPMPGPNYTAYASLLATNQSINPLEPESAGWYTRYLYLRTLYDPEFVMSIELNSNRHPARVVVGHLWGGDARGPVRPVDVREPVVMVINKMPSHEDAAEGRQLTGQIGHFLKEMLTSAGLTSEITNAWYVTSLVRWPNIDPKGGALSQKWIKDCLPVLHQELRLVRPDYILCLGAEATKAVCHGEVLKTMAGRAIELRIPLHEDGMPEEYHTAKVMAVNNPSSILRNTDQAPAYIESLKAFKALIYTGSPQRPDALQIDVRCIYTARELHDVVDDFLAKPGLKKISLDAEWHGEHPGEPGSYLRTIQLSYELGKAVVVVLSEEGGMPCFWPSYTALRDELNRMLDRDDVQYIGHFFQADSPWLHHLGVNIVKRLVVPATVEGLNRGNYAGIFDTGLSAHAHDETAEFKLELLCNRYLGVERWDVDLNRWKAGFCTEHDLKADDLEGYGECPADILLPYGGRDAGYGLYLAMEYQKRGGLLDSDRYGLDSWIPFWRALSAFPAFLEMHMHGLKVDRRRVDELTDLYMMVYAEKLDEFRRDINWNVERAPGIQENKFNPNSSMQCKELLFGEQYSGKIDPVTGATVSVRPPGAITLNLMPVKSAGAKSKPWVRIVSEGETHNYSPCTDKETLGILGADNPIAARLRDIRFLAQVLKSVLRPPEVDDHGQILFDANNNRIYQGGLISFICRDDRVRSAFLQTMETGRASSRRPPLQNISNKRETDYKRILGDRYRYMMRSIFVSNTDPYYGEPTVIIGADYSGAELLGMAVGARDQTMIDHCQRASFPDGDPRQYDIHSNIAVLAFHLDCAPTKKALKAAGKIHLRIAAKNIIFGVGYGRGAEACSRQCKEENAPIEPIQAQQIIDTIFTMYSRVPEFQAACKARVRSPGWMRNAFYRMRRFIASDDRAVAGELERESLNFPMQSLVADAVNDALRHLRNDSTRDELGYRIALQLHDAIYLEVPVRSVDRVYHEVLPRCMVDKVWFKSCDLNGDPYPDSPDYHFTIDKHVYLRWGESLTTDMCDSMKLSHEYAHEGD